MRGRSSRKSDTKRIVLVTVTFIAITLFALLLPRLLIFVSGVVLAPITAISEWFEQSDQMIPVMLRDRTELTAEIKRLESELVVAKGQDQTFYRLQDENNRLRTLLGATPEERIVAGVIARPNDLPYDLLQIDQGVDDAIVEGALVYAGNDQLLGQVVYVARDYSLVKLFTSPESELTGFIAGPDALVTIEGVGGGVARAKVPQGVPISIGNLVYLPSVQPGMFGRIEFIDNRPSQPEQYAYITLDIALQSLHFVAVTKSAVTRATQESILQGKEYIIAERLLVESANTTSFEELQASSTNPTVDENEASSTTETAL